MNNLKKTLYSLRDITIIPSLYTTIKSRQECNPFTYKIEDPSENQFYPLIASPMSSVVNSKNYFKYWDNKISCIIPRTVPLSERLVLCKKVMCAFSLKEIKEEFLDKKFELNPSESFYVLIDIANGHMRLQINYGSELKQIYGSRIVLMGGNIANPNTYYYYNLARFDYVRCGIGGGAGCITSTQTGIHYPMASLINDIVESTEFYSNRVTKIVADGGIETYSDAIKCLALGADYVMMGKTFAKSEEAAGEIISKENEKNLYRIYRGMSTKESQAEILGEKLTDEKRKEFKTSEGKSIIVPIEYTLDKWINNFDSYLRSSMSYCNAKNLQELKNATCQVVTANTSININEK